MPPGAKDFALCSSLCPPVKYAGYLCEQRLYIEHEHSHPQADHSQACITHDSEADHSQACITHDSEADHSQACITYDSDYASHPPPYYNWVTWVLQLVSVRYGWNH
jgi:hypothetical protein